MKYNMNAPEIRVLGRTIPGDRVPVFWTGSGIETTFGGNDLYLEYESQYAVYEDWIRVELDGVTIIKMPLEPGHHTICLLRHIRSDLSMPLKILKEVQPMNDDPERILLFDALITNGKLYPPKDHPMKIEFVGDSLTAGQGLSGPKSYTDWTGLSFSTDDHYAFVAAQELDAEIQIVAQGGWGVATAWDNNVQGNIPRIYDQVCSVATGSVIEQYGGLKRNAFDDWQADFVIVNLGTNDASAFQQPPWVDQHGKSHKLELAPDGSYSGESSEKVIQATAQFLEKIRRARPNSRIIWAYGMCGKQIEPLLREGIQRFRAITGDEKVKYLSLLAAGEDEYGSNDHPGPKCHIRTGMAIADEIRRWMAQG